MKRVIQLKQARPARKPFGRSGSIIAALLACFALLHDAQAVVPPPDGGYPGFNTAEGQNALFSLTTGVGNTAVGWFSLWSNTDGSFNTGVGAGTLLFNTADQNTAFGAAALLSNTIGFGNTAVGVAALVNNTTGGFNTANGADALSSNTTGDDNTAIGDFALSSNTEGSANTATGGAALQNNTTGNNNTAIGISALRSNTTGNENVALGSFAGVNLTNGDRNIDIGNQGDASDSFTIRIGADQSRTFIAGIRGVLVADSVPVVINPAGQLGTIGGSSRRLKNHIKPMEKASEAILALKPVTFRYKGDSTSTPQFGLIAEEVAEINPDLVIRDKNGEICAVRYDAVNAMLLNEFLKEHRKVDQQSSLLENQACKIQEQEATIAALKKEMETVVVRLKDQDSKIQKVKTQIEMSKSAPQIVVNP